MPKLADRYCAISASFPLIIQQIGLKNQERWFFINIALWNFLTPQKKYLKVFTNMINKLSRIMKIEIFYTVFFWSLVRYDIEMEWQMIHDPWCRLWSWFMTVSRVVTAIKCKREYPKSARGNRSLWLSSKCSCAWSCKKRQPLFGTIPNITNGYFRAWVKGWWYCEM